MTDHIRRLWNTVRESGMHRVEYETPFLDAEIDAAFAQYEANREAYWSKHSAVVIPFRRKT